MRCGNCKEELRLGLVDHVMTIKDKTVLIKEVPAMVWSQCGEYYFKIDVMRVLERLVKEYKLGEINIFNYKDIA